MGKDKLTIEEILDIALSLACADIQEANQEYTVEQIKRHYLYHAKVACLEDWEVNGRQDH